jgi:SSS family solute:Na+ symporter
MIYIAIIIVYLVLMVVIGILNRRLARSTDGFFVADRSRPMWLIIGSLVATIIGGSATVGMAGLGFTRGVSGIWWLLVGSIGLLIMGLFLAAKVRNYALYTIPQLLEKQYNSRVSLVASILIVIAWLGVIAGQIVATGKIMSVLQIGNPQMWMIVFTVIFISYTLIGGQYADIGTDMVQAVLIFIGIITGLVFMMIQIGGWDGLTSSLPPDRFSFPTSSSFGIIDLISYIFLIGLTYVVGPDIYSKIFCAKDAKTARRSTLWTAGIIAIFAVCITLVGMGASVLFPKIAPEQAFPFMITNLFPPVIGGLVLAALVSATMSSADSCVLSGSTILTLDVIKKLKPTLTEKQTLLIARGGVVLLGLLSLLLALFLSGVINALLFAYTVYTAGVILPTLAGFYKEKLKVTPLAAMVAIIGGGGIGLISKLLAIKYLDLGALFISALLLFAVSFIERRVKSGRISAG